MLQSTRAEQNSQTVRECYDLTFNKRKPKDAAAKYIGETYVQHNPLAPDGAQAFVNGITAMLGTMPAPFRLVCGRLDFPTSLRVGIFFGQRKQ